jgi:YD repeat-containing protein
MGSYTYGDPNHLDATTAVGTTYTASYDAAGDMTCRAPTNTVTCSGTPTGAVMTYDNERRLATWQNTPSNPTSTALNCCDGEG